MQQITQMKAYKFHKKSKFINVNICRMLTTKTAATRCVNYLSGMAEMYDYILFAAPHCRRGVLPIEG